MGELWTEPFGPGSEFRGTLQTRTLGIVWEDIKKILIFRPLISCGHRAKDCNGCMYGNHLKIQPMVNVDCTKFQDIADRLALGDVYRLRLFFSKEKGVTEVQIQFIHPDYEKE